MFRSNVDSGLIHRSQKSREHVKFYPNKSNTGSYYLYRQKSSQFPSSSPVVWVSRSRAAVAAFVAIKQTLRNLYQFIGASPPPAKTTSPFFRTPLPQHPNSLLKQGSVGFGSVRESCWKPHSHAGIHVRLLLDSESYPET